MSIWKSSDEDYANNALEKGEKEEEKTGNVSHLGAATNDTVRSFTFVGVPVESLWGLGTLCTFTTLFSVIGNLCVIVVLTGGKRWRTDLSKFLVNLAAADLAMALFCMPFTFTTALNTNQWVFGQPTCTLVLYVQLTAVTASVATSTAIAVDRYLAITRPLMARAVATLHRKVLVSIWAVSLGVSSVQLFVARIQVVTVPPDLRLILCQEEWPEPQETWAGGYTVFVFVVTYLLPLSVIAVTYVIVCRKLRNRKLPGNADRVRDSNQLRSTRKIVKMLVTVVALFGVCWLPLHLFNIYQYLEPSGDGGADAAANSSASEGSSGGGGGGGGGGEDDDDGRFAVFMAVHWLAMSNSFVNPVIYGFLNDGFRSDLKHLTGRFVSWCLRRRPSPSPETDAAGALTQQRPSSDSSFRNMSGRFSKETWSLEDADHLAAAAALQPPSVPRGDSRAPVSASRPFRRRRQPGQKAGQQQQQPPVPQSMAVKRQCHVDPRFLVVVSLSDEAATPGDTATEMENGTG